MKKLQVALMLSVLTLSGVSFTAQTASVYAQKKKDGGKEPVPPPVVKDKDRGKSPPPPPKKDGKH